MAVARANRWAMRAASLVAAAAAAGCSLGGPSATATPEPTVTAPSATASPAAPVRVQLYFVGDTGTRVVLYREAYDLPADSMMSDPAQLALAHLLAQGVAPVDADYANLWGNGTTLNSITYAGTEATIDLTLRPLNVGSEAEMRAIDQLVWTLTDNHPGITTVRLTSGGAPLETLAGHVDATQAFQREPDYDVLAPIWVDEPGHAAAGDVTVTGTACTFEAGVAWELVQDGQIVRSGSTTAGEACPVRSPWQVVLVDVPAGEYVFRAIDYSAKDGSVTQQDTKPLTVK